MATETTKTSALRHAKDLLGYSVRAKDGKIGEVTDLYFDDERWTVRYVIVDTGGWLTGRRAGVARESAAGVADENAGAEQPGHRHE